METFLYVIGTDKNSAMKIGYSKYPEKRLKQLQTGHPEELRLYYFQSVSSENVKLMEQAIHSTNRHKKIKGEWFNMTADDAIVEVQHAIIRYSENMAMLRQKLL